MSDWHYAEGGARRGPVSEPELRALLHSGRLPPDTLVWREGFPEWRPAEEVPALQPPLAEPGGELRPYAPPAAASRPTVDPRLHGRERPWPISLLCAAWVIWGSFCLFAALAVPLILPPEERSRALGACVLLAVLGTVYVAGAVGLWRLRGWGWSFAVAGALLTFVSFPAGLLIGILLLVYLGSSGVRVLYSSTPLDQLTVQERQALSAVRSSGVGTALGCFVGLGLALLLLLVPIALPGVLDAFQRGRQRSTLERMRTVAKALEARARETGRYPAGGPEVESLRLPLEASLPGPLPANDAWGAPLRYEVAPDGMSYTLESFGRDGVDSGPQEGAISNPDHDLVMTDGVFTTWPEGMRP